MLEQCTDKLCAISSIQTLIADLVSPFTVTPTSYFWTCQKIKPFISFSVTDIQWYINAIATCTRVISVVSLQYMYVCIQVLLKFKVCHFAFKKKCRFKQRGSYHYNIYHCYTFDVGIPSNVCYLPSLESVKYFACFLSKDTIFKLMVTKMIQGCLISILVRVDIPCMVRSLFTFRKCWSVQIISVPCVSKSNTKRFCIWIYNHPAKPQPHRRPRTWVRDPPEQVGLSLTFLCQS